MTHPKTKGMRISVNREYNKPKDGFGNLIKDTDKYQPNVMNTPYCPACGKEKLQFKTKKEALMFIQYNAERIEEQKGYAPIRAYYCNKCKCWHITSKELKPRYEQIETSIIC